MRKSKSLREELCFCDQYRFGELKLKTLILEKVGVDLDPEPLGVQRTLNMLFQFCDKKQKTIDEADALLRTSLKQDPTVKYSDQNTLSTMIETLTGKIKREKQVHHLALQRQSQVIDEFKGRVKEAEEESAYLKELLNEEQIELQNWKSEAQSYQTAMNRFKDELSIVRFQNDQLRQIQRKHSQIVTTLNNRVEILETDKHKLSQHCLERTEDITKLARDFENIRQSLQYKAKIEYIQSSKQEETGYGSGKYPSKKDMLERMRSLSLVNNRYQATSDKLEVLNHSLQKNRSSKDDELLYINALNRSISTANPQSSRWDFPLEKSFSLDCGKDHLFGNLFVGDVLHGQEQYRYYLVSVLQQCHKTIITRTKLLYKWDHFNTINIHKFIDGRPHVVFLIKTDKGQFIGAYSQGPFRHREISNQLGLLLSFNHELVFRNTKKSIIYDENDVIFGNYDLRVRAGDSRVTSAFGSSGCYYDHQGHYASTLLGEGRTKQAKIRSMEAFQVSFQS